eukprot:GEMP01027949.1.p1 GENE.GEMP01027949.1~~GEMP01027949.1.p1  ORF type:complete len:595 (+),score=127.16 GEMP01027949.1:421-2205(+)
MMGFWLIGASYLAAAAVLRVHDRNENREMMTDAENADERDVKDASRTEPVLHGSKTASVGPSGEVSMEMQRDVGQHGDSSAVMTSATLTDRSRVPATCGEGHVASKCREYGKLDDDCCAKPTAATCADGYHLTRALYGCGKWWIRYSGYYLTCCKRPVNGGWGKYGSCSVTCGVGRKFRFCNKPVAANGGKECEGEKAEECTNEPCEDIVCQVKKGDEIVIENQFPGSYMLERNVDPKFTSDDERIIQEAAVWKILDEERLGGKCVSYQEAIVIENQYGGDEAGRFLLVRDASASNPKFTTARAKIQNLAAVWKIMNLTMGGDGCVSYGDEIVIQNQYQSDTAVHVMLESANADPAFTTDVTEEINKNAAVWKILDKHRTAPVCSHRVHGVWGKFSPCSVTCGVGEQTRKCDSPVPANGGKDCTGDETQECTAKDPCPVNGAWAEWSACTAKCGDGDRTRKCDSPKPANGGTKCEGDSSEKCTKKPCGGKGEHQEKGHTTTPAGEEEKEGEEAHTAESRSRESTEQAGGSNFIRYIILGVLLLVVIGGVVAFFLIRKSRAGTDAQDSGDDDDDEDRAGEQDGGEWGQGYDYAAY